MLKLYLIIALAAVDLCSNGNPNRAFEGCGTTVISICEPKARITFTMNRDEAIRALAEDNARVYQIVVFKYKPVRFAVRRLKKGKPKYEVDSYSVAIKKENK